MNTLQAQLSYTNQPIKIPQSPPPHTSAIGLLRSRSIFLCPNHLKARYQTIWESPYTPELLKLFQLTNPKPTYPASLIFSLRDHSKGSCPCFPLASSASWSTLVLLHVIPLGNCNKLSFQCQLSPELLVSPYLIYNKIYILKQKL